MSRDTQEIDRLTAELRDTRTGKGVEVYFSPMGNKVTATLTGESK